MRRATTTWPYLSLIVAAAGCSTSPVQQQPLYAAPSGGPGDTLVLGGWSGTEEDWIAARNDQGRTPMQLYTGPSGKLYYKDGSPVEFHSVRRQLEDLRAQERINPVR